MLSSCFVVVLVSFALLSDKGNSEKFSGHVNVGDDNGFSFLGKFCFRYRSKMEKDAGYISINLDDKKDNDNNIYQLMLYDDEDSSFSKIYHKGKTCTEKTTNNYQRASYEVDFSASNDQDNGRQVFYEKLGIHQHIRPRWWYVYLANCNESATFKDISFDLHFEQAHDTDWSVEFGMNERDLNTVYLVYLVIYIGLVAAQVYAYFLYRIQQYIHQVIKLQTATMIAQMFGILFHFVDWMIFMQTGEHELFFPVLAIFCDILAGTIFLLLLFVLAQGWTITRFEVRYPRLLLGLVIFTGLVRCGLYIWRLVGLNEQSTVYFYNSLPEMIYGGFMIAIGVVFEVICIYSWKRDSNASKRMLYLTLACLYGTWFLWFLIRIFIGGAFSPWVRDIAITAISVTVDTTEYTVMMLLLWPTWAHNYFNLSMVDTQSKMLAAGSGGDSQTVQSNPREYQVMDHDRL